MHWFISFPNEPDHFLHEQIIDFNSLIRIVKGEVHSQLDQMSRIHRMMLRYSERKAQQFLLRFPKIYWAPEEEIQTLFYMISEKSCSTSSVVARWKINPHKELIILRERRIGNDDNDLRILNTGVEFHLYFDPNAVFTYLEDLPYQERNSIYVNKEISDADEKDYLKNVRLRQKLRMKYSWKHEARDGQVRWVKKELPRYCRSGINLNSISNTSFEIMEDQKLIGMINIMEYKVYVTFWDQKVRMYNVFGMNEKELVEFASRENIELIYTNSL